MLFSTLILVSVDCEHDRLQQGVDLSHGDESTKMGNMPWLGLEQEQEVAIFLSLLVIGEEAFLQITSILKMAGDFVLLFQCHAVLNEERDALI